MIGNIVALLILAGWTAAVIIYICRQKKAAKSSGNHICIGCPGAAHCSHNCRK